MNEARWLPSIIGNAGQQCTYDALGNLITAGIAAGSADSHSPGACGFSNWLDRYFQGGATSGGAFFDHYRYDIRTWQTLPCWQYVRDWPAGADRACASNPVSSIEHPINGVDHMYKMTYTMTCEEATILIREARESAVIDSQLRGYILGLPIELSAAQIKAKLQLWRVASSDMSDSLWPVIDKAIARL